MVSLPSTSYDLLATDIHMNIAPRILPLYVRHNTMGPILPPVNEGSQPTNGCCCNTALCVQYHGKRITLIPSRASLKGWIMSISQSIYIESSWDL